MQVLYQVDPRRSRTPRPAQSGPQLAVGATGSIRQAVVLLVSLVLISPVVAADFAGRVVGIADGDTLTVLSAHHQIKVRLADIDAPEKAQAYGQRSRQSLADLCFQRAVRVEDKGHDRYGRTVGRVFCDGADANSEQVRRGMAWVYDRYCTDRSLYAMQDKARRERRGLWSDLSPVPPWDWRRDNHAQ